MRKSLLSLILTITLFTGYSGTKTSIGTGTVGTPLDWHTGASWSPAGVPTATDEVVIATGDFVEISSTTTIGELRIHGNLSVSGTPTLSVLEGASVDQSGSVFTHSTGTFNMGGITLVFDVLWLLGSGSTINAGTSTVRWTGSASTFSILRGGYPDAAGYIELYNLEIDPASGGIFEISSTTIDSLGVRNIVSVISGTLKTNDRLKLVDASVYGACPTPTLTTLQYGRFAFHDETNSDGLTRTPYTGVVTGKVIVEKKHQTCLPTSLPAVNGKYNGEWFQMSLPVNATLNSAGEWSGINFNLTGGALQSVWYYDAYPSATYSGRDATENALFWQINNNKGWTAAVPADDQSKAYTIFLASDAPFKANEKFRVTGDPNITYSAGDPNQTNTYNLYLGGDPARANPTTDPGDDIAFGWNLVRNPWPTIIETGEWLQTGIPGVTYKAAHVWNSIAGQYEGWTNAGVSQGGINYNTAGGIADQDAASRIPPFQAFWVKIDAFDLSAYHGGATQPQRTFTAQPITLDKRYTTSVMNGINYQKTSGAYPETAVLIATDMDGNRDITMVFYENGFTHQFDKSSGDLFKLQSIKPGMPTLNIKEGGYNAMSAGRGFVAVDTVDVVYKSEKNNTTANLFLNDTNISSNYDIMLYDKLTGNTQDMRLNVNYSFVHSVNNQPDRFQLILTNKTFDITDNTGISTKPMSIYTAGDELVIESNSYTGPAFITIYDMAGRIVMNRNIELVEGVEQRTLMPNMANALYSVEVNFAGKSMVEKLMR